MARPKATDPKKQRNFYPPESVWDELEKAAAADGVKPPDLVLTFVVQGLELRTKKAGIAAARDAATSILAKHHGA